LTSSTFYAGSCYAKSSPGKVRSPSASPSWQPRISLTWVSFSFRLEFASNKRVSSFTLTTRPEESLNEDNSYWIRLIFSVSYVMLSYMALTFLATCASPRLTSCASLSRSRTLTSSRSSRYFWSDSNLCVMCVATWDRSKM
jgi:hypothetical protein